VLVRPADEPPVFSRSWWRWAMRWVLLEAANGIREAGGRDSRDELPCMTSGRLLAGLAAAGMAVAGLGFAVEAEGFAGNALAGLSSLILGSVLAVALIDQLLRRRHREHWSAARDEICRAICEAIVDMASSFALFVSSGNGFLDMVGPEDDAFARPRIGSALCDLIDAIRDDEPRLSSQLEPDLASSRTLYDEVSTIIASLRTVMTTRVVVLGDEPQLVAALLNLERAERQWESWVVMVERDGAPDGLAWRHATATLQAGADVYSYFLPAEQV
jgi:hypothetical protein